MLWANPAWRAPRAVFFSFRARQMFSDFNSSLFSPYTSRVKAAQTETPQSCKQLENTGLSAP